MDIESRLVFYLRRELPGTAVHADVPRDKALPLVTLERTGGISDGIALDRPMVAVQCWAETRAEAKNLAYTVKEAMERFDREQGVFRCELSSMSNFPSGQGEPRYQLAFQLTVSNLN